MEKYVTLLLQITLTNVDFLLLGHLLTLDLARVITPEITQSHQRLVSSK